MNWFPKTSRISNYTQNLAWSGVGSSLFQAYQLKQARKLIPSNMRKVVGNICGRRPLKNVNYIMLHLKITQGNWTTKLQNRGDLQSPGCCRRIYDILYYSCILVACREGGPMTVCKQLKATWSLVMLPRQALLLFDYVRPANKFRQNKR